MPDWSSDLETSHISLRFVHTMPYRDVSCSFFFQAEDGIRDIGVTGVQTCALPISWTPEKQEGATACASAHYFSSRGDGVLANAFYDQGVRFLDVSDPRDIRQIGWWRPASGVNTWEPHWHKGIVFVADQDRGIEILRFKGSAARSRTVRAPALREAAARSATQAMDPALGYLCPLPDPRPATPNVRVTTP